MVLMLAGLFYFLCLFISRSWRGWVEKIRDNFGWFHAGTEEGNGGTVFLRAFGRSVYVQYAA